MRNTFESWTDDDVLRELKSVIAENQRSSAQILVYLLEVESRRIHLDTGPSLYEFCVAELGMSEDQAGRRVAAAAVVKRFPKMLSFIERGDIHLTNLLALRPYLTDANHEELAKAASRLSKTALQELFAERFPRSDVPSSIEPISTPTQSESNDGSLVTTDTNAVASNEDPARGIDEVRRWRKWQIEQLSTARFRVEFTADQRLRDQIGRAMNLLAHRNPTRDLAVAMRYAFDLAIEALEKERLGKTTRDSSNTSRAKTVSNAEDSANVAIASDGHASIEANAKASNARPAKRRSRSIRRRARRGVFKRDGEQCTFVGRSGKRCSSRSMLEIDHIVPRAQGGTNELSNLRVVCRAHNHRFAETIFGRAHMDKARHAAKAIRVERKRAREASTPPIANATQPP